MPRLNLTYEQVVGFFTGKHPEARKAYVDFLTKEVREMNAAEAGAGGGGVGVVPGKKRGPKPKGAGEAGAPPVLSAVAQDEAVTAALEKKNKKKPGPKKGSKNKKVVEAAPAAEAPATEAAAPAVAAPGTVVAPPVEA